MHRPVAAAIYRALADSVFSGMGDGPIYLSTQRFVLPELVPHKVPPTQIEAWVTTALLSSNRFGGICNPDTAGVCDIPSHGVTLEVSDLYYIPGSDTVILGVAQGTVNPPADPHPWPGFGEYDWFYLLEKSTGWVVVKIATHVIS